MRPVHDMAAWNERLQASANGCRIGDIGAAAAQTSTRPRRLQEPQQAMISHMSNMSSERPPNFGPNVDMVAAQPNTSLSDPGVGLRNNGRRVLPMVTYAP